MQDEEKTEQELGVCCGDFYNHPLVSQLLDGIFHPGGLALSKLMADRMKIDSESTVLDIACGDGRTATYLARSLGCKVSGIDASQAMIDSAKQLAEDLRVKNRTDFKVALAGKVPYDDDSFTAAFSECSLCTFYSKDQAVKEIRRVLKPEGIFGLHDVTVQNHEDLEDELRGLLGKVACIADALSSDGYIDFFKKEGFSLLTSSNHSDLLEDLADKAKGRARFFKEVSVDKEITGKLTDAVRIIGLIKAQIVSGNIGYGMFVFKSR
ncbi:MAG: class I SAM-dependent methyltransferase [Candidatus Thorarchaeota archaeon]|nr:class I SAM-dependent methyltransferase [Candidatus Thorarchaeota archaeon]